MIYKIYLDEKSMPSVSEILCKKGKKTKQRSEWSVSDVSTVLRNQIYKGIYSVGEITESVEEYRIMNNDLFDQVTQTRLRFQQPGKVDRPAMGLRKKRKHLEFVLDQYGDYHCRENH